jgi:antitoxin YefM
MYIPWYIEIMRTATFSEARANLARTWDQVVDDAEPITLTRVGHAPVVMVSLAEYESMRETMYLRRSPRMAGRIDAAIARFEAGEGVERELIEP